MQKAKAAAAKKEGDEKAAAGGGEKKEGEAKKAEEGKKEAAAGDEKKEDGEVAAAAAGQAEEKEEPIPEPPMPDRPQLQVRGREESDAPAAASCCQLLPLHRGVVSWATAALACPAWHHAGVLTGGQDAPLMYVCPPPLASAPASLGPPRTPPSSCCFCSPLSTHAPLRTCVHPLSLRNPRPAAGGPAH